MKKNTVLIIASSILLTLISIFVLDYAYDTISMSFKKPYAFNEEYFIASGDNINAEKYHGLITTFVDYDDIVIFSEYSDESYIGVYDQLFFTKDLAIMDIPKYTRHFSKEDFINKNPVAFFVDYNKESNCNKLGPTNKEGLINSYINCVVPNSTTKSKGIPDDVNDIINLSAIPEVAEKIYVSYLSSPDTLVSSLKEIGYEIIYPAEPRISLMTNIDKLWFYNWKLFTISFTLNILMLFVFFFNFYKQRKKISIHISQGAKLMNAYYINNKLYLLTIPLQIIIVYLVYYLYQTLYNQIRIVGSIDVLIISIISYLYFALVGFITFTLIFKEIKNKELLDMLNNIILGLKDFKKYWVVNVLMIILFTFTIIFVSITNLILIQEMEYRDFDINANIEDLTMFDALRKTLDTEIDEEIIDNLESFYIDDNYSFLVQDISLRSIYHDLFIIFNKPYNDIENRKNNIAYIKNNDGDIKSLDLFNNRYTVETLEDNDYNFDIRQLRATSENQIFIFVDNNYKNYFDLNETHQLLEFVENSRLKLDDQQTDNYINIFDDSFIQIREIEVVLNYRNINYTKQFMKYLAYLIVLAIFLIILLLISGFVAYKSKEYSIHLLYGATRLDCITRSVVEFGIVILSSLGLLILFDYTLNRSGFIKSFSLELYLMISLLAVIFYGLNYYYNLQSSKLLENLRGDQL